MMDTVNLKQIGVALLASRLCILGDDPCGGSEVVLWEDACILKRAGIPVRVYACSARPNAPVQILPFRTRTAQLNTIEYARSLLRREPNALILAYNEPALAGFAPDRTIVRFDWTTPLPRYWNWPLWLPRFRRARYLFPSVSERQIFLNHHSQIPATQAVIIPNAVDLELFQPTKQSAELPSNSRIRIGFAGQWSPEKGIQPLLAAFTDLHSAFPAAQLVLAGGPGLWKRGAEPPGSREATSLVREMEAKGLLDLVGTIPRREMPRFWNSVDIAVVPSLMETFGLSALEALACGVPVVAFASGGLKEIMIDGECGLLVPPGDADALHRALAQLVANESLRLRLAAGARRRAQDFSLERRSCLLSDLLTSPTRDPRLDAQPARESSLLAR